MDHRKVSGNLKSLREGMKLDLASVAVRSGLPLSEVREVEETGRLSLEQIVRLSRAYQYTPGGLVNRIVPKGRRSS